MRTPLLCLTALALAVALPFPLSAAAAPAKPRNWTDNYGRTIAGDFVEADATEVTIRRPDGTIVRIPRDLLSPADLAFADQAQSSKPITVKLEVSRTKFGSARDDKSVEGLTTTTDQWGYNVVVINQTRLPGKELRADYVLYVQQAQQRKGTLTDGAKIHRSGSEKIAVLELMGRASFRTNSIATKKHELQPGWVWGQTGNTDQVIDTLEGIWLRVYQGNTLIAEFLSSESFRKAGWPSDAPKPPVANNQAGQRGNAGR
jgi:hypothetical protein